jgi:hypothetical protein
MSALNLSKYFIMPPRIYTKLRYVESGTVNIEALAGSIVADIIIINQPDNIHNTLVGFTQAEGAVFYARIYRRMRCMGMKFELTVGAYESTNFGNLTLFSGFDNELSPTWISSDTELRRAQSRNLSQRKFVDYTNARDQRYLMRLTQWAPMHKALSKTRKQIFLDEDYSKSTASISENALNQGFFHWGVLTQGSATSEEQILRYKFTTTFYVHYYDRDDSFLT